MGTLAPSIEGQIFGKWLVLQDDAGRDKHGNKMCLCECQCPAKTKKLVKGYDLRAGRSTNCGCERNKKISKINFKDETGKKYGKLTVLFKTEKKSLNGQYYWICQCDCGNKKIVRGDQLRNGTIVSCGCYGTDMRENSEKYFIGAKFGYLELLGKTDELDKYNYRIWNCKCWACGKNCLISTKQLRQGKKSCCISNSLGEKVISDLLNNNNIKYIKEYTTDKCRYPISNAPARFDFYILDFNYIIEFDGVQHFKEGKSFYDNPIKFKETQTHDEYKNQWCKENNIPLIRIPYWHLDEININDLLLDRTEFLI